jgi:branched-subunit amino acid aminotransferase/4-amino-4-deoxychorismate lyase
VDEDGSILEGLSSNFFAIKRGELWTAENEVLSGITRLIVLEEGRKEGLDIHLLPVNYSELPGISESFITSSSRAVLPVVKIDNILLGNGRPGSYTRLLSEKFLVRIKNDARVI